MEDQMISLLVGIISSLFATAIFIGASELIRRIVLPWYADKVYRGVRIDGRWELIKFKETKLADSSLGMFLDLMQKGDIVSGKYSLRGEDGAVDVYDISGRVRDSYLLATAVPISNRQVDGAALLFYIHYKENQLLLSGQLLHREDPGGVGSWGAVCFAWRKP
jgi:hypothetical protein